MKLNHNNPIYIVDRRSGEITEFTVAGFHNYLIGSNYKGGPFDVDVFTEPKEAERHASVYQNAERIRQEVINRLMHLNTEDDPMIQLTADGIIAKIMQ